MTCLEVAGGARSSIEEYYAQRDGLTRLKIKSKRNQDENGLEEEYTYENRNEGRGRRAAAKSRNGIDKG